MRTSRVETLVDMFANLGANGVIVRWERILGAAVRAAIGMMEAIIYGPVLVWKLLLSLIHI